jgi:hypothetical protein
MAGYSSHFLFFNLKAIKVYSFYDIHAQFPVFALPDDRAVTVDAPDNVLQTRV